MDQRRLISFRLCSWFSSIPNLGSSHMFSSGIPTFFFVFFLSDLFLMAEMSMETVGL